MNAFCPAYPTEYKAKVVARVIDSGHPAEEVASELRLNEYLLRRWVADEQSRRSSQQPATRVSSRLVVDDND